MRIFTAIPLPDDVKRKVTKITSGRLSVPYVNTTNLHITLNFFGELTEDRLQQVKKILDKAVVGQQAFEVQFNKIIKFHQQIHMTVRANESLNRLQANLENAFRAYGYKFNDRVFYAHVKLANMHMDKVMHRERKIENFPNEELQKLSFLADKVVLFESRLLLHHAHHTALAEYKLS